MLCEKCGEKLDKGMTFCPECGAKVESEEKSATKVFCMECGTAHTEQEKYCTNCGTPMAGTENLKPEAAKKKGVTFTKRSKMLVAAVICIAVLGVAVITIAKALSRPAVKAPVFYIKDNELYTIGSGKDPAVLQSQNFFEVWDPMNGHYWMVPQWLQYSEDGNYLYYPGNIMSDHCTLYVKDLSKAESRKIDSDVRFYKRAGKGQLVYVKIDGSFYLHDLEKKDKIASDVEWFSLDEKKGKVLWLDTEGRLYTQNLDLKEEKIKLDSDVPLSLQVADDFSRIVYMKDDNLYVYKDLKEKVKIASDVSYLESVQDINGDMKVVYVEQSEASLVPLLIEDDLYEADQALAEPDITAYQTIELRQTYWGETEKVITDEAYYHEYDKYQEKLNRDQVRLDLEEELTYYISGYNHEKMVYSQKTGKTEPLKAGLLVYQYGLGMDANIEVFLKDVEIEKILFSDYMENGSEEDLRIKLLENCQTFLSVNQKYIEMNLDLEEFPQIDLKYEPGADYAYLLIRNDWQLGELIRIDGLNKESQQIRNESADVRSLCFIYQDQIVTIRNNEGGIGELYLNDELVDEDVILLMTSIDPSGERFYYFKEMNKTENAAVLYCYEDGKSTKIAEDVSQYKPLDNGEVILLVDYNSERGRGDLMQFKGGKLKSIDYDVNAIIQSFHFYFSDSL